MYPVPKVKYHWALGTFGFIVNRKFLNALRTYIRPTPFEQCKGTIDLLMYDEKSDSYIIVDWKTSSKIATSAYRHKTGNHDITRNLEDCNFNHYSLQLSLYRYILENYYGLKVTNQMIVHITDTDCRGYITPYLSNHIKLMAQQQINTKDS